MRNRRRGVSLKSALKLRLTRYMLFLVVFALATLGLCVLFFFLWSPIPRQLLFIADPHAQSTARIFGNTVRSLFVFFFVLNLLFLWLVSAVARSVLGPFVRIDRVLDQLARGDLPQEVRFRKNDEAPFQEIADPLNKVLDHLRTRRGELKAIKDELEARLSEAEGAGMAKSSLDSLKNLSERIDKLAQNAQ